MRSKIEDTLGNIRLTVQQQLTLSGSQNLTIIQGDDYTRAGIRLDIDTSALSNPSMNLSTYHLIVAFRTPTATLGYRLDIGGSAGSHFAIFAPPSSVTELWPTGTFALLYRIEWASNEFQTLGDPATMIIEPFDLAPGNIADLATPE